MSTTLIDILLGDKKISAQDADVFKRELETKKITEEDLLLSKISEQDVFEAKSKFYGVPLKKLEDDYTIPHEVLAHIPEETAKMYTLIPLARVDQDTIEVGVVNPQDVRVLDALKFILTSKNLNAKIFLITKKQFNVLFQQYSSLGGEVKEALSHLEEDIDDVDSIIDDQEGHEDESIENAPVARIVAVIFKHAFESRASDIHIEPLDKSTRVRFRVDGILHINLSLPKNLHSSIISRIKILANLKIDESRVPQDGRFRSKISGSVVDFRVSSFPTINGEKIVMRLLDPFAGIKSMEDLGFIGKGVEVIKRAVAKPYGMLLITGPTGSGKSTTLQSLLGIVNKEGVNIVSLEDPVEYNIEGVSQSQVRPELGYTFSVGLRSILRQDPDILMVGEIRDRDTAILAVQSALTGHMVLTTLHTNNAIGVIPRLINMGIDPYLVPPAVLLAAAQRLVRKLCNDCKHKIEATGRAKDIIEKAIEEMPADVKEDVKSEKYYIWEAGGCGKCGHKGTKGRMVIFEAMEMTIELKKIIIEGITEEKVINEAIRQGMLTMRQDGILKALDGYLSLEEVLQSTG